MLVLVSIKYLEINKELCFLIQLLLQAFAWFSDLLVEHSEIFWSLFAVDMDTVRT